MLNSFLFPGYSASAYHAGRDPNAEEPQKHAVKKETKAPVQAVRQEKKVAAKPDSQDAFSPLMTDLQSAVVMSEILGSPRAYRHRHRRRG